LGNASENYVLTDDITITSHTPIGTGNGTAAFSGKFYGNGHSINVASFANVAYTGIFGFVSGATIRDLTVNYSANVSAGSNATTTGGLVGYAEASTKLINCLVLAQGTATLSKTGATTASYLGGIAGTMQASGQIINAYCSLNVRLDTAGNYTIDAGGVVGFISTNSAETSSFVTMSGIQAVGNVEASGNGHIRVGGLAGESNTKVRIEKSVYSGEVKMTGTVGVVNVGNCGGLIGGMKDGSLIECDFTGSLVTSGYVANGPTVIGGIVANVGAYYTASGGGMSGTLTGNNTAPISISKCTVQGNINFTDSTGTGKVFLGGVSGWVTGNSENNKITFDDCEYRYGSITVTKTKKPASSENAGNFGGFAGDVVRNTVFTNCRILAESITMNINSGSVGGFCSVLRGTISGCYTNTRLNVTYNTENMSGKNGNYVGGFAAIYNSYLTIAGLAIENCYAGGTVTVTVNDSKMDVRAGGFLGGLGDDTTGTTNGRSANVKNCYALGAVTVIQTAEISSSTTESGLIYAGGFVGYMRLDSTYRLENCYAAGEVLAQSAATTTKAVCYAGGLVGYRYDGAINRCAALGASVTAKGGYSRAAGRIYGTSDSGSSSYNYALERMRVGLATTYSGTPTYQMSVENSAGIHNVTAGTRVSTGPATVHGQDTVHADFFSSYWWTSSPQLSAENWDYSNVFGNGRPFVRASANGAVLGGQ
jgi:hypothetical protein